MTDHELVLLSDTGELWNIQCACGWTSKGSHEGCLDYFARHRDHEAGHEPSPLGG